MVSSTFQIPPFHRRAPLAIDTSHAQRFSNEDEDYVLDDNILDHSGVDSGLEMSPPMVDSRRESFAVGPSPFSPKNEGAWAVEMQSVPSNNTLLDGSQNSNGSNNPFMRMDTTQAAAYGSQGGAWSMSNGSGSCTPIQQFDGLPQDYDAGAGTIFSRPMAAQNPFAGMGASVGMFSAINAAGHSIPTSPQKEWMGQPGAGIGKKTSPSSPTIRSHNDLRRGDGIRKKNARFDIPAERNLSNIDTLIAQSTDEGEIKELKQQKRLLRNRQAALDSRQRKKQHTERLEDEKKQFNVILSEAEEELSGARLRIEQLMREKQSLLEYIEGMTHDKENMIRQHTLESGELRKKVSVLTDHVQRLESSGMVQPMPAAAGPYPGYDDMDGMTMTGTWDNVGFLGDYPVENEVKQEAQVVPAKKSEINFPAEVDKPAAAQQQGGLLFMLFLVGAFVLSNRSPTPAIPRVPEDVRAASATLLDNVLKDAGVGAPAAGIEAAAAPQPSGTSWNGMPAMELGGPGGAPAPSMLGELGDALTQPTQEQANEQLFSMTAAQYNGVSSQDYLQNAPERSTSQGRRNLADALAAVRSGNKQTGAAEVYTRSLLWDQIPSQVVRDFAKMVEQASSGGGGGGAQNEQQQCSDAAT